MKAQTICFRNIIDLLYYYRHAKLSIIYANGKEVICDEWDCHSSGWMVSFADRNSLKDADIEIDLNDFNGQIKLHLISPYNVPDTLKNEYNSKCRIIKCNSKMKYVDTPNSIAFMFKNNIDAFDLIENGFAISI